MEGKAQEARTRPSSRLPSTHSYDAGKAQEARTRPILKDDCFEKSNYPNRRSLTSLPRNTSVSNSQWPIVFEKPNYLTQNLGQDRTSSRRAKPFIYYFPPKTPDSPKTLSGRGTQLASAPPTMAAPLLLRAAWRRDLASPLGSVTPSSCFLRLLVCIRIRCSHLILVW